jgi:hypothetical protein
MLVVAVHNLKNKTIELVTMATISAVVGSIVMELVCLYKGKKITNEERVTSFGIAFVASSLVQILAIKSKK